MNRAHNLQRIVVRPTRPGDFPQIAEMSRRIYPNDWPWDANYLASHLKVFPEGQLVAEDAAAAPVRGSSTNIVGMAASLVVSWEDYEFAFDWNAFTDEGYFTNHDALGRTLYGAEVMVDPGAQGMGVGKQLYAARRQLCKDLGLRRIRAGARLRGYQRYAHRLSAEQYVIKVIRGEIGDPTLSFQLKQGFRVIAVVGGYLKKEQDPASRGFAAVIEWINPELARAEDYLHGRYAFEHKQPPRAPWAKPSAHAEG